MPWKGEKDPYKIWLSEIMLQQTRVEQGLKYYHNFIKTFPLIQHLADAPDEKIYKLWEGLGYYTRCRNLIATARYISREKQGRFPSTYDEIRSLKGIGPYTAAAIGSFAFNLPFAVLDGNVFRVLARVFGIAIPTDSSKGKKLFSSLAQDLLDKNQAGIYNQAIMDYGAMICKPAAPLCDQCVFKKFCVAFIQGRVNELPVKEKKINIKKRWFYYLVMEYKNEVLITQRTAKDIWQHLFEFPLVETGEEIDRNKMIRLALKKGWLERNDYKVNGVSPVFRQQLSHQLITGQFLQLKLKRRIQAPAGSKWVRKQGLAQFAFPRFVHQWLRESTKSQSRSDLVIKG